MQFRIEVALVRDNMIRQSGGRWRIPVRVADVTEGSHRATVTAIDTELEPVGESWAGFTRQGDILALCGTGENGDGGGAWADTPPHGDLGWPAFGGLAGYAISPRMIIDTRGLPGEGLSGNGFSERIVLDTRRGMTGASESGVLTIDLRW